MILYKYVRPERVDILENARIRFTQSDCLNDPFEISPNFDLRIAHLKEFSREFLKRQIPEITFDKSESMLEALISDSINDLKKLFTTDYLVLSLTAKRNNLAMWSHYTDLYKGFVIGFNSLDPFFHQEKPRKVMPVQNVSYSQERPIFPKTNEDISDSKLEKMLLTKSHHWSYEEEYRMLAKSEASAAIVKDVDHGDIYLFDFPTESLSEIILGYRMPKDLKRRIFDIAKQNYINVQLFEAELSKSEFDLEVRKYAGT